MRAGTAGSVLMWGLAAVSLLALLYCLRPWLTAKCRRGGAAAALGGLKRSRSGTALLAEGTAAGERSVEDQHAPHGLGAAHALGSLLSPEAPGPQTAPYVAGLEARHTHASAPVTTATSAPRPWWEAAPATAGVSVLGAGAGTGAGAGPTASYGFGAAAPAAVAPSSGFGALPLRAGAAAPVSAGSSAGMLSRGGLHNVSLDAPQPQHPQQAPALSAATGLPSGVLTRPSAASSVASTASPGAPPSTRPRPRFPPPTLTGPWAASPGPASVACPSPPVCPPRPQQCPRCPCCPRYPSTAASAVCPRPRRCGQAGPSPRCQ